MTSSDHQIASGGVPGRRHENHLVSSGYRFTRRMAVSLAIVLATTLAIGSLSDPAAAQGVTIIGNDRGGLVGERASLVDALRAGGERIEIRGNLCYSACTMYLGAGDVCVSPQTTFGFHGPSRNGTPLPPATFDHWSRVMARYYNEPLRQWFMTEARYTQTSFYRLSGQQIISLGYAQC